MFPVSEARQVLLHAVSPEDIQTDVMKKDSYSLSRLDDTLTTLSGSKWSSTIGLGKWLWASWYPIRRLFKALGIVRIFLNKSRHVLGHSRIFNETISLVTFVILVKRQQRLEVFVRE